MQTRLFIELSKECRTGLYFLPFGGTDLPPGAYIPPKGEKVTLGVLKPQATRELLEPRNFEVIERHTYIQCESTDGTPFRAEVTLVLKDLGSAMTDDRGLGALGENDPVYLRTRR